MTTAELIAYLQKFPKDMQVFLSGDPEGNEYRTINALFREEFEKSNNNGTFDAVVIFPTDDIIY